MTQSMRDFVPTPTGEFIIGPEKSAIAKEATAADIEAQAMRAGFRLESWMTSPPKPAMWHGTPEAMETLVRNVAAAEREQCARADYLLAAISRKRTMPKGRWLKYAKPR